MTTNVATKTQADKAPADFVPADGLSPNDYVIEIGMCQPNAEGRFTRDWHVDLPLGCRTVQDVHDHGPRLWRRVQSSRKPIRQLDRLRLVDAYRTFVVEAICVKATTTAVELGEIRVVKLPPSGEPLPASQEYETRHVSGGMRIYRRADNVPMSRVLTSAGEARQELELLLLRAA